MTVNELIETLLEMKVTYGEKIGDYRIIISDFTTDPVTIREMAEIGIPNDYMRHHEVKEKEYMDFIVYYYSDDKGDFECVNEKEV